MRKNTVILPEARIIGVRTSLNPGHPTGRPSLGLEKALNEIQENRGVLYDETVVDVCLRLVQGTGVSHRCIDSVHMGMISKSSFVNPRDLAFSAGGALVGRLR